MCSSILHLAFIAPVLASIALPLTALAEAPEANAAASQEHEFDGSELGRAASKRRRARIGVVLSAGGLSVGPCFLASAQCSTAPRTAAAMRATIELEPLWTKARRALSAADRVVIVGYSMPETDGYAMELITDGLRKGTRPSAEGYGAARWVVRSSRAWSRPSGPEQAAPDPIPARRGGGAFGSP